MKTVLLVSLVIAVTLFALGSVSTVSADYNTPLQTTDNTLCGFGGRGGMMGVGLNGDLDGYLHDEMVQVFSDALGIPAEDLEVRLTAGETLSAIALEKGMSAEEFNKLMLDARNQALAQAVQEGILTQTQADWMESHSFGVSSGNSTAHTTGSGMGTRDGYRGGMR